MKVVYEEFIVLRVLAVTHYGIIFKRGNIGTNKVMREIRRKFHAR